jgi:hypothetical protein
MKRNEGVYYANALIKNVDYIDWFSNSFLIAKSGMYMCNVYVPGCFEELPSAAQPRVIVPTHIAI